MKRLLTLLILVITYWGCNAQQKGDSLAILYHRVYAYKNPGELSTRYDAVPFSYFDKKKLVFISESEKHPHFWQVKTTKGDTVFVRSELVSANPNLSHQQIAWEVENGIRKKNHGDLFFQNKIDIPVWASILIFIVFIAVLYLIRKHFTKIDRWFCRKEYPAAKQLLKPWFINYSLYAGLVIGSVQLISRKEYNWFMQDGMQLWGSYPGSLNWVMWAAVAAVVIVSVVSVAQAFMRFKVKVAVFYSAFSLVVIVLYYFTGLLLGAIAFVLAVLYAIGSGASKSSARTGTYNSGTSRVPGNDPSPVGATKYDDSGQQYVKNTAGSWEKRDGII